MVSLASHNVSTCFPNFLLPSTRLKPVVLAPRFSRSRPLRRSRLSPPSNTVSPAPGAKGLLALPAPILFRIVSFITRPCSASRFCSSWTRRPIYKSTLTAFATTSIYLLLVLQYHIDLPPGFLIRKVKPKEKDLPSKPCCEVDPEEAYQMRALKYYLGDRRYYDGSYTLAALRSALKAKILEKPRPKPAIQIPVLQKLSKPYPPYDGPKPAIQIPVIEKLLKPYPPYDGPKILRPDG